MGCESSKETATVAHKKHNSPTSANPVSARGRPIISSPSSRESFKSERDLKWKIPWSDISLISDDANECVIGRGTNGIVLKAYWKKSNRNIDVAVKVFTRSSSKSSKKSFEEMCNTVWSEIRLMKEAERNVANNDCIVRAYGVCEGVLPDKLTAMFNLPPQDEGVALIMKYEGGGSLESCLYLNVKPLKMKDKIHLLVGIAQALVELHSAGIVHGDIKPGNILLSHHTPPEIRLANFGMSLWKDYDANGVEGSTLQMTSNRRGTPVYSPPEMLVNPYDDFMTESVAQCSRKTDMYSFAILAWEVLSGKRPFEEFTSESVLCIKVHRDHRPSLDKLPDDTPAAIITMITNCWSKDRSMRKSAVECASILQYNFDILCTGQFDIFLSHAWIMKPLLSHVYQLLTKAGYRVWYDQREMGYDLIESMKNGIASSKVVLACVNRIYQSRDNCMFELREASIQKPNHLITMITDDDPFSWSTSEIQELCNLKSRLYINISEVALLPWNDDAGGPTVLMMEKLKKSLEPLFRILQELDCQPSLLGNNGIFRPNNYSNGSGGGSGTNSVYATSNSNDGMSPH